MKLISLTQNKFACIDSKNYKWLNQFNWQAQKIKNTWYATCHINGEYVYMHRLILGLKFGDGLQVDHRDHCGLNNRICNLRICTNQ